MFVFYTDRVKNNGASYALLQEVSRRLEELIGPSVRRLEELLGPADGMVKAEWDQLEDASGRTRFRLRLSDPSESIDDSFEPSELQSASERDHRLLDLWGDLLQIRNHRQLKELIGAGREGD
jgi:hypothetical protein